MKIWGEDIEDSSFHPLSRIEAIKKALKKIPYPLSYVDLCCGRGEVIKELAKDFQDVCFLGIDLESYPEWKQDCPSNVIYQVMDMEEFFKLGRSYTVCSMLNTFRNWPKEYLKVRDTLYDWLRGNVDYFITSIGLGPDTTFPYAYEFVGIDAGGYKLIIARIPRRK